VLEKSRKLAAVASDIGISQARLALTWCLKNPAVSTLITGATRPEQVIENMLAIEDQALLTAEVMARIETILSDAQ
jgi:aryl-alcohol dehydrogenase-like predicted oxidoreductase